MELSHLFNDATDEIVLRMSPLTSSLFALTSRRYASRYKGTTPLSWLLFLFIPNRPDLTEDQTIEPDQS